MALLHEPLWWPFLLVPWGFHSSESCMAGWVSHSVSNTSPFLSQGGNFNPLFLGTLTQLLNPLSLPLTLNLVSFRIHSFIFSFLHQRLNESWHQRLPMKTWWPCSVQRSRKPWWTRYSDSTSPGTRSLKIWNEKMAGDRWAPMMWIWWEWVWVEGIWEACETCQTV